MSASFSRKRLIREGDRVDEGPPYYCSLPRPGHSASAEDVPICGGYIGPATPGARLDTIQPGRYRDDSRFGIFPVRCPKCGAHYVFSLPVDNSTRNRVGSSTDIGRIPASSERPQRPGILRQRWR